MNKSFNLYRYLTQFLTAEKARLTTLENDKHSLPHIQLDRVYEARRQQLFYTRALEFLKEDPNAYNEFIKYAFQLWELQRKSQPTPYPFVTFQFSSDDGKLFGEDVECVFISPEEIESKIGKACEDGTSTIPNNNVCRFYSVDPIHHTLTLEKTYTYTNQGWKRGLQITEEQYNAISNKRVIPEFELWRLWPLFSIKEIKTIVATSKNYTCSADYMLEFNEKINKELAVLDEYTKEANQILQEADNLSKSIHDLGKQLNNYSTLKNLPSPTSPKKYH